MLLSNGPTSSLQVQPLCEDNLPDSEVSAALKPKLDAAADWLEAQALQLAKIGAVCLKLQGKRPKLAELLPQLQKLSSDAAAAPSKAALSSLGQCVCSGQQQRHGERSV